MSALAVRLSLAARGWPARFPDSYVPLPDFSWRAGLPFLPVLRWSPAVRLAVGEGALRILEVFSPVPGAGGWFQSIRPAGSAARWRVIATASKALPFSWSR